jgi:hypothetical protein
MRVCRRFVPAALALFTSCLAQPSEVGIDPSLDPGKIEVGASEVHLVPFTVRMNKLAHVLELPIDDPLFDALYQQRYSLGDHEYARALRPDRRWGARKMGIWIKGLLPICSSPRFRELYPDVADDPSALILRAYGRPADSPDTMTISEALDASPSSLDREVQVCLAVLSSLELVAQ